MGNSLFRILFVDDEIHVLRGMKNSYDWGSLGFHVVGEAGDADSALALARKMLPDVVITDICMDGRDGLSLITDLKSLNPATEVIILSGYPDFQYAKSAMERGAFAYLLKPLKNSEFLETLERVKARLWSLRREIPSHFLSHLLQLSPSGADSVAALAAEYRLHLPGESFFVAILRIDGPRAALSQEGDCDAPPASPAEDGAYDALLAFFQERFLGEDPFFVCRKQERHPHMAALIYCRDRRLRETLLGNIRELAKNYTRKTGLALTLDASGLKSDIASVREAYLEASRCLLDGCGCVPAGRPDFRTGASPKQPPLPPQASASHKTDSVTGHSPGAAADSDVFQLRRDAPAPSTFIGPGELSQIVSGIRTLNRPLTEETVHACFARLKSLKSPDWDMVRNAIAQLAMQIVSVAAVNQESMGLVFGRTPLPAVELFSMNLFSEMQDYIRQLIDAVFDHADIIIQIPAKYSKPVRDTQIYIYRNYPLRINVDTIANALHINKYHLMRLFKQETGGTIGEFLTSTRIEAACKLLQDRDCPVSEAGRYAGYPDANYFGKVFKKQTGLLPSEYRERTSK